MQRNEDKQSHSPAQPNPQVDREFAETRSEIQSIRDQLSHFESQLQAVIHTNQTSQEPVQQQDLQELETLLLQRMHDMLQNQSKLYADRQESKKAFKLIERQVKNLFDLVMSQGAVAAGQDAEALFGTKHLCGYSCASCEKGI